ncbi:hypothetical protein QR680_018558 [Steinernema hermaphroditum]|uniref:Uncharacterized protein n=1 Tax=Steinernema hermaphroditum TaxID=289476 RepID=A0AA39HKN1_9BILA|nr:hypothetical protein QR680_018558 [Steinernema hermaphroditum]
MNAEDAEAVMRNIEKIRPKAKVLLVDRVQKALEEGEDATKQALFGNVDVRTLMLMSGMKMPEGSSDGKRMVAKRRASESYMKPRMYDVERYRIGAFEVRQPTECQSVWRNRVKANFQRRVLQFSFYQEIIELTPGITPSGDALNRLQYADPQLNVLQYVETTSVKKARIFTVHVPFNSIVAICFEQKNIYVKASNAVSLYSHPFSENEVLEHDHLSGSLDPTNGEIFRSDVHILEMRRDMSAAWKKHLLAADPVFFQKIIQDNVSSEQLFASRTPSSAFQLEDPVQRHISQASNSGLSTSQPSLLQAQRQLEEAKIAYQQALDNLTYLRCASLPNDEVNAYQREQAHLFQQHVAITPQDQLAQSPQPSEIRARSPVPEAVVKLEPVCSKYGFEQDYDFKAPTSRTSVYSSYYGLEGQPIDMDLNSLHESMATSEYYGLPNDTSSFERPSSPAVSEYQFDDLRNPWDPAHLEYL